MKLNKLLNGIEIINCDNEALELEVLSVSINSKSVEKNSVFVCLKGENFDGHSFVKEAELRGAIVVICEDDCETVLPKIKVKDCREAYAKICSNFYGSPEKSMKIIGVTGTNGKTSTVFMIAEILNKYGIKTGIIGTLGAYYCGNVVDASLTTPDPSALYKIFADMKESGVQVVVMEVSAHACELKKIAPIEFYVGVFTNLTQDHLDYFKDMENYKKAKLRFLNNSKCKYLVVNSDDLLGRELTINNKKVLTYGIDNPADVFAINIKESKKGTSFVVNLFDDVIKVFSSLYGRFNVYNEMCSMLTACLLGVPTYFAVEVIENFNCISGRLEKIYDDKFMIFIDYAHTPDGLEKSISALKRFSSGRLITLFGCGGNRDKDKRAKMGKISADLSDFSIITSDNPRFEDPMSIIKEIEKGFVGTSAKSVSIENRRSAIEYALSILKKDDVLLIAGKGAERSQEILGVKQPFDDKEVVLELLSQNRQ